MKNRLFRIMVVMLLAAATAACLGCFKKKIDPPPVRPGSIASDRVPEPSLPEKAEPVPEMQYTVLGQTYTPLSSHEGYVEEGIASWYGPKFHGQTTSSGEIYNMYEMSAAHRILPMNTLVRVTSLENGKVINLRINDRGPFAKDRIIDLSFAAAKEIEMIGPGTARVRVEATGIVPKSEMTGNFYVQVGSFTSRENALQLKQTMQKSGYHETRLQQLSSNGQKLWRVQAGMFTNLMAAENAHSRLVEENPGAFIIAD